jgi:hypothetical protein
MVALSGRHFDSGQICGLDTAEMQKFTQPLFVRDRRKSGTSGMSALGQKQTFAPQNVMSALPPKADICAALAHVNYGPKADSCTAANRTLSL